MGSVRGEVLPSIQVVVVGDASRFAVGVDGFHENIRR